jgi:hypothetical protein
MGRDLTHTAGLEFMDEVRSYSETIPALFPTFST